MFEELLGKHLAWALAVVAVVAIVAVSTLAYSDAQRRHDAERRIITACAQVPNPPACIDGVRTSLGK